MNVIRKAICILSLLAIYLTAVAQPRLKKEMTSRERWQLINSSKQDSSLVDLMIEQGQHYVWRPERLRNNLDTALMLASRAASLAENIHYKNGFMEGRLLSVKAYIAGKQFDMVNGMIAAAPNDPMSVHAMLLTGEEFLQRPGNNSTDLDTALTWFKKALQLAERIHYIKGERESLRMIAKYYFEQKDVTKGKETYLYVIDKLHAEHNYLDEADWLIDLGYRIPDHDTTFNEKAAYMTQSLDIYTRLKDRARQQWVLGARAEVYRRQGKLDLAEQGLLQVLTLQKAQGDRYLQGTYRTLMEINMFRGDLNKALSYGLACVQCIDDTGDSAMAAATYERLGDICSDLNDHLRSVDWYRKALLLHEQHFDKELLSPINYYLTKELIAIGQTQEALNMLNRTMRYFPPKNPFSKEMIAGAYAAAYTALSQYNLAEKHYNDMLYWERATNRGDEVSAIAYYSAGKFFLDRKQYQRADAYLDTALSITPGRAPVSLVKDIHLLLFKTDSVLNHYEGAIHHLRAYQLLNDSIYNADRIKQLEELQIKYETSQKEKDIVNLRAQSQLQQHQIAQSNQLKRVTFGSIILLALLLLLSINRYRLKQRSVKALARQQKEITDKNISLQRLVEEKEWLIKEVHHRVKNNLQIVMSLLNTQSNFLESEAALAAIRDSAHRMQSISLIHQKLYQSEYLSLVSMPAYIHELVHYLQDSYRGMRPIYFNLQIASVEMDVSQAVPMGLILSEAVTNAIKYAFPRDMSGVISISLDYVGDDQLMLVISDNGQGLPEGVNFSEGNTLGVRLIQTFAAQLEGELTIESKFGLTIRLVFRQQ